MNQHGTYRPMNQNIDYNTDYMTDAGRVITDNASDVDYGDMFSAHGALETLVYGTPHDVLIQTPEDKYLHLKFLDMSLMPVQGAGSARFQLWEDADAYVGGDTLTNFIRRRPSIVATTSTTTVAPTTSTTSAPTTTTTAAPTTTTTGTTTTAAPTTTTTGTTTTAAPTTSTTSTTGAPTTTTSTTPVPTTSTTSTTEAPVVVPTYELDYRLSWTDIYRFIWTGAEARILPTHPGTSSVIIKEGGVATLGGAVEIDAGNFQAGERVMPDRFLDHKWVFKKDKLYVLRFWRLT